MNRPKLRFDDAVVWMIWLAGMLAGSSLAAQDGAAPPQDTPPATAAQDAPPADETPHQQLLRQEVQEFFDQLTRTIEQPGSRAVLTSFSSQHVLQEAIDRGWATFADDAGREEALRELRRAMRKWFEATNDVLEWDHFNILRLTYLAEDRVEVVVQHRNTYWEQYPRLKWRLVRLGPQSWKVYDWEDLEIGLPVSTMMGVVVGAFQSTAEWRSDLESVIKCYHDEGSLYGVAFEFDAAPERIDTLLASDVPAEIVPFLLKVAVTRAQNNDDPESALQFVDRLDMTPDTRAVAQLIKGHILMGQDDFDLAVECFEAFGKSLGFDSHVYEMMSDCYFQLGERALALESAEKGMADNETAYGCLASLAVALPASRVSELVLHFERMGNPEGAFETVLDWAIEQDEIETGAYVFTLLKRHHPDSDLIEYYNEIFVR